MLPNPDQAGRQIARARSAVRNVIGMTLIIATFGVLAAVHIQLDGWSTLGGAAAGITLFVLFFSPVITRIIMWTTTVRKSPWYEVGVGLNGLLRDLVVAAILVSGVLVAYFIQSWHALMVALLDLMATLIPL